MTGRDSARCKFYNGAYARRSTFHLPDPGRQLRAGPEPHACPAASTAPATATEQTAPDTAKPEGRDRTNQRVEHIHVEDGGSRVDELRVGGQTRSITVQPKVGDMPSYEVQSNDGARSSRNRGDGDGTNGTRVWNLKKF